jgi:hypothetical protein
VRSHLSHGTAQQVGVEISIDRTCLKKLAVYHEGNRFASDIFRQGYPSIYFYLLLGNLICSEELPNKLALRFPLIVPASKS